MLFSLRAQNDRLSFPPVLVFVAWTVPTASTPFPPHTLSHAHVAVCCSASDDSPNRNPKCHQVKATSKASDPLMSGSAMQHAFHRGPAANWWPCDRPPVLPLKVTHLCTATKRTEVQPPSARDGSGNTGRSTCVGEDGQRMCTHTNVSA